MLMAGNENHGGKATKATKLKQELQPMINFNKLSLSFYLLALWQYCAGYQKQKQSEALKQKQVIVLVYKVSTLSLG